MNLRTITVKTRGPSMDQPVQPLVTVVTVTCAQVDPQYPGTAVERLQGIHLRVKTLSKEELSGDWQDLTAENCQ